MLDMYDTNMSDFHASNDVDMAGEDWATRNADAEMSDSEHLDYAKEVLMDAPEITEDVLIGHDVPVDEMSPAFEDIITPDVTHELYTLAADVSGATNNAGLYAGSMTPHDRQTWSQAEINNTLDSVSATATGDEVIDVSPNHVEYEEPVKDHPEGEDFLHSRNTSEHTEEPSNAIDRVTTDETGIAEYEEAARNEEVVQPEAGMTKQIQDSEVNSQLNPVSANQTDLGATLGGVVDVTNEVTVPSETGEKTSQADNHVEEQAASVTNSRVAPTAGETSPIFVHSEDEEKHSHAEPLENDDQVTEQTSGETEEQEHYHEHTEELTLYATVEAPPCVSFLVPTEGSTIQVYLFQIPETSTSQLAETDETSEQSEPIILFHNRPELYQASLSDVFAALRSEPLELSVDDELQLHFKELNLTIGEDNRFADEVSISDLDILQSGNRLDGPLKVELLTNPDRFISRYRAMMEKVQHDVDVSDAENSSEPPANGSLDEQIFQDNGGGAVNDASIAPALKESREIETAIPRDGTKSSYEIPKTTEQIEQVYEETQPTETETYSGDPEDEAQDVEQFSDEEDTTQLTDQAPTTDGIEESNDGPSNVLEDHHEQPETEGAVNGDEEEEDDSRYGDEDGEYEETADYQQEVATDGWRDETPIVVNKRSLDHLSDMEDNAVSDKHSIPDTKRLRAQ